MKKIHELRIENAELYFNSVYDEKGIDLLRNCIKSILDEKRTLKSKKKAKPKLLKNNCHTKGV